MRILSSILLCLLALVGLAQDTEIKYQAKCIGFYNIENLFDTLDTPNKNDKDFLPEGRNRWNTEKYTYKLGQLGRVISEIGVGLDPKGLAILGVAEVENRDVLEDLIAHPSLSERGYKIVFEEGPDRRGIDVGLLYDPESFEVESWKSYTLSTEDTSFHTRDQLLVTGNLHGERMHFIVAHWPSRSGGQKRSEPKRMAAAELGKNITDSILNAEPGADILYMGDLNDDPVNKSVTRVMRAASDQKFATKDKFYNPMHSLYNQGVGSLAWRDTWNLFDQILLSPGLLGGTEVQWEYHTTRVFNKPYLANPDGNFKGYPYRTFAGGSWQKGFSDHFPVYVVLKREVK